MPATDASGRPYAKLSELQPGDKVQVDDGFTCIKAGAKRTVWYKGDGLCIRCGGSADDDEDSTADKPQVHSHYLVGQLSDDGDSLIGIYKLGAA